MIAVPLAWAGETVTVLATGPSLTQADVDLVRGKTRVIAVNDAHRLAPWAEGLFASDVSWWLTHRGVPEFTGAKWSIDHVTWDASRRARFADVQRLANTGTAGLETQPTGLRSGANSGYAAINLAVHYGAATILLLGYDMRHGADGRTHFFGNHPGSLNNRSPYHTFLAHFNTLVQPLREAGVRVINCSPVSDLRCFPSMPIADALAAFPSQAVAA